MSLWKIDFFRDFFPQIVTKLSPSLQQLSSYIFLPSALCQLLKFPKRKNCIAWALWWGSSLPPSQRPNPLLSALRALNFGPVGLEQLLLIRSSPSQTISGSATGYGHERVLFFMPLGVNAFRGMTASANSCIVALFITDLMLSLCVKSSSLIFLPCTLKIIYLFRQNA